MRNDYKKEQKKKWVRHRKGQGYDFLLSITTDIRSLEALGEQKKKKSCPCFSALVLLPRTHTIETELKKLLKKKSS